MIQIIPYYIYFNCSYYPEGEYNNRKYHEPRGGEKMDIMSIDMIEEVRTPYKNRCQCFNTGYRVTNDLLDFKYWNGCHYEDIDYKKWIYYWENKDKSKIIDPNIIINDVNQYILSKYSNNFMFSETSRSGKGFHIVFFFNCEKTEYNWYLYKSVSVAITKEAFIKCGYADIINFTQGEDKVYDDCTFSPVQMIYITKHNLFINEKCNGQITFYPNLKTERIIYKPKTIINKNKVYSTKNHDWNIQIEKFNVEYVNYIPHTERWKLFCSLSRLYKGEELRKEWEHCANMIPNAHGHDTYYYKTVPYKLDWYRNLNGKEYIDIELLKQFGYNVKFINKEENEKTKKIIKKRIERIYL